jgi:hypothetical protein
MVVLVKEGTSLQLYVDGVPEGAPVTHTGTYTLTTSAIGALRRSSVGNYFAGTIDEVALFNRALTAEEIATLYRRRYREL